MDPPVTRLSLLAGIVGGALAFSPIVVAAISIVLNSWATKRRAGVDDSVLSKYRVAALCLVCLNCMAVGLAALGAGYLLGVSWLFWPCTVAFFVMLAFQFGVPILLYFIRD